MQKIILLLFVVLSLNVSAQHHEHGAWCGTEISKEWIEWFYHRDKSHLEPGRRNLERKELPIIYHIVGRTDGTGYYTMTDLLRLHCDMQSALLPANLHFWVKEINYIDNTDFFNGNNTSQLFNLYNNRDVLNVYIVSQMSGVCGYSYVPRPPSMPFWGSEGPNRGGIMLAANCLGVGSTTYAHEAGHYFNLPHTFFGWENQTPPDPNQPAPSTVGWMQVERVDRTNCSNSGDGFCDTGPDYISSRWNCNQTPTYLDPNGTAFQPDGKNFMSYSNDACTEYFSADQYAEMNNTPSTHRSYLLNLEAPDMTPLAIAQPVFPVNVERISPNPDLKLIWNKVERAEFYLLQVTNNNNFFFPVVNEILTDTFFVLPTVLSNRGYKWRVRPFSYAYMCTDFSAEASFTTAAFTAEVDLVNESCFGTRDGSAFLKTSASPGSFTLRWTAEDPFINSQLSVVTSSLVSDLPAGNYTVTVVRNFTDTCRVFFTITSPPFISLSLFQDGSTLAANITGGVPPYTIIWSNGSTSSVASNPDVGENTIILVDQVGCQKTGSVNFDPNAVNIGSVIPSLQSVNIYPNPSASGAFNIDFEMLANELVKLDVFNVSGQRVKSLMHDAKAGKSSLNVELNAAPGVYIIRMTMGQKTAAYKVTML
jgi:hypothetical protein